LVLLLELGLIYVDVEVEVEEGLRGFCVIYSKSSDNLF
jgi:hypothetical protein